MLLLMPSLRYDAIIQRQCLWRSPRSEAEAGRSPTYSMFLCYSQKKLILNNLNIKL